MSGPEDPPRWSEGGDAPAGFDALRKADDARVPDALQLNRMLQGIGARVGQPELGQPAPVPAPAAPNAAGSSGGSAPAPSGGASGLAVKVLAGVLAAGLFVGVTMWLGTPTKPAWPAAPREPAPAPAPERSTVAAPLAPMPVAAPPAEEQPVRAASPKAVPQVIERSVRRSNGDRIRELAVVTPAAADPAAELALLERAQKALRTDPRVAYALAEQHKQRFEDGVLAQEREMLAIEALIALDKKPAAERRARAFENDFPHSTHLPRLLDLLRSRP